MTSQAYPFGSTNSTATPLAQRPVVRSPRRVDRWLLGSIMILVCLGVVMVFDASFFVGKELYGDPYAMIWKHVRIVVLATGVALFLAYGDARRYRRLSYPLLLASFVLLAVVLVPGLGVVRGGARRWLSLLAFSFEPSELVKPAFVLYLAHSLCRKQNRITSFSYGVLPHAVVAGACIVLLLAQPDFGAGALLVILTLAMLFAAGARTAHLAAIGLAALPVAGLLIWMKPYRWVRILAFLNPWADPQAKGFQLVQSFIAFGSGGLTGVGLGNSNQKLFYLPEGHTDFIFALVGEELGLAGAMLVLGCFALIALRGFRVALRVTDPFASLVAFGLTFLLVGQAAMNMAVVLGLLPTKGLALPFLSYGGSAMLASGIAAGTLLGLSREVR